MATVPGFLRTQSDGVYLSVKVQPRAARNEIGEPLGNELRVRVTAPPVESAANEALLRMLTEALDCPRRAVALVRGHTSRHKVVLVQGLPADVILRRLGIGQDECDDKRIPLRGRAKHPR